MWTGFEPKPLKPHLGDANGILEKEAIFWITRITSKSYSL
jgi:hypothetical protein